MEKLALSLVLTVRRLQPYLLSHPVTVLTNSALDRVLTNLETSEQLIKWATELSEYDIQYQPRTTIKAQALTDFLTKTSSMEVQET